MAISENPKTIQQEESATSKEDEIKNQIVDCIQTLDALESLYGNNLARTNNLNKSSKGVDTGPWKNISAAKIPSGQDKIFDYITGPGPTLNLILISIPNYQEFNYNNTFDIGLGRLQQEGGVRQLLTQAQTELETFNIKGYQNSILLAKDILYNELLNKVETYVSIIDVVNNEINRVNGILYKGDNVYGPFSAQQINNFTLPPELIEIRNSTTSIISEIKNLINKLDKLVNIPEDVLIRTNLSNIGLIQSNEDPNVLSIEHIEEKDPWGIRFSYTKSVSASNYIDGLNNENNSRANRTLTHDNQTREPNSFIETSSSLNNKIVNEKRDFYFQLLPAIKSNLPVSAGTDAPGALPGVQFRIENNIVKHRIPGFAPIYQPLGIDSIKCTLIGMFTGNDGKDISSAYSDDLNTGLLLPNKNSAFGNRNLDNRFIDGTNTPIPSESKSNTSTNVAVLSEDAFRGAQEFYNEIVAPAQEVEVELNLRKGSLNFAGGEAGPFRDELTGNPKFKALIKKVDLYYVRRDRCWFILDLEITNSGLISNKCINLTNTIDEAVNLFEQIEDEPTGLTKEQLDKCFVDPIEIKYKNEKSGYALVIDKASGLSYEYKIDGKVLSTAGVYPTPIIETLQKFRRDLPILERSGIIRGTDGNNKKSYLPLILQIIIRATKSVKSPNIPGEDNFTTNRLKLLGFTKSYWAAFNKNDGLFYIQDIKGNLVNDEGFFNYFDKGKNNKVTLKELNDNLEKERDSSLSQLASFGTVDIDQAYSLLIDDYLPFVNLNPNSCEKLQVSDKKQQVTKEPVSNTSANNIETSNSNQVKQQTFFQENNKENLNQFKTSVSNGDYNTIINTALNQATTLMIGGSIDETNSVLTPGLIKVIKNDHNSKKLYISIKNSSDFTIELTPDTLQLDTTKTTEKELYCTFKYNVSRYATIFIDKREYILYPNGIQNSVFKITAKEGFVKIQKLGNENYKINALSLLAKL